MNRKSQSSLPRRQREIMEILYRRGRASVSEVVEELSGNAVYSTVRAQLRILTAKGHAKFEVDGMRYVYLPTVPHRTMRKSALRHLVDTFFQGSTGQAMAALIGDERASLTDEEIHQLEELLNKAKKGGRK
jgi:BlaI family transcriptional regulator, penicillinase repressor